MAENKKSFIAYADWIDIFEELEDDEAGRLVKHLWRYVNDLNPSTNDRMVKVSFTTIRNTLKRDLLKYQNIIDRNRENGKKGGRPKKPSGLIGNPDKHKKADSVNDSDSVNVNDTVNEENINIIGFNIFWNKYDKKVGRDKCEKKWNKLSDKDQKEAMEYIPKYINAQPDKIYRKNPETFLNQKSWNDEIINNNETDQQINKRKDAGFDNNRFVLHE